MLIIGSRGSQLALWQARWIQTRLAALGEESSVEVIHTTGDRTTDVTLSKAGLKGLFTKEIEEALLGGDIDVAVHSMNDTLTEVPSGLTIAAIPEREDARDALVGRRWTELADGARVGTSSLRRAAQLRARRPGLQIESVRGNVDTRIRKLDEGQYDAVVLAAAGLRRLGLQERIAEILDPAFMCPAVGQGALAVETRDDDGLAFGACAQLDDPAARTAVTAERALLASLGGGCQTPIGAHARVEEDEVWIDAVVVSPDGSRLVRRSARGPLAEAGDVGSRLGAQLLGAGAREILDGIHRGTVETGLRE